MAFYRDPERYDDHYELPENYSRTVQSKQNMTNSYATEEYWEDRAITKETVVPVKVSHTYELTSDRPLTIQDLRDFVAGTADLAGASKVIISQYDSQRDGFSVTLKVTA